MLAAAAASGVGQCMHALCCAATLRSSFAGSTRLLNCAVPPAYFQASGHWERESRLYLTYEENLVSIELHHSWRLLRLYEASTCCNNLHTRLSRRFANTCCLCPSSTHLCGKINSLVLQPPPNLDPADPASQAPHVHHITHFTVARVEAVLSHSNYVADQFQDPNRIRNWPAQLRARAATLRKARGGLCSHQLSLTPALRKVQVFFPRTYVPIDSYHQKSHAQQANGAASGCSSVSIALMLNRCKRL